MKKAVLFLGAFILSFSLFAQTNATPAEPQKTAADVIKFNELTYDFGKIKQNTPVNHDFTFTNKRQSDCNRVSNRLLWLHNASETGRGCSERKRK